MYGTVARLIVKPGVEQQLAQLQRDFEEANVTGFVGSHIYRMDANPNEYLLAVIFDSKEHYVANARSPEQNARYQVIRALLEQDPEWHDGEIIYSK